MLRKFFPNCRGDGSENENSQNGSNNCQENDQENVQQEQKSSNYLNNSIKSTFSINHKKSPSTHKKRSRSSRGTRDRSDSDGKSGVFDKEEPSNQASDAAAAGSGSTTIVVVPSREVPELDPLVLSDDQKANLKSTWAIIYAEMGQALSYVGGVRGGFNGGPGSGGVAETFLRLFEEFPQSQEFFTKFRGTPVVKLREDVKMSTALQEHAVRVMQVVEKVIGRIENLEKVNPYLLNLGKFHRHAGIPSDYFGVMGTIFCHAVRPYLEEKNTWNLDVEDVWMELFSHIARVMTHGHMYYMVK